MYRVIIFVSFFHILFFNSIAQNHLQLRLDSSNSNIVVLRDYDSAVRINPSLMVASAWTYQGVKGIMRTFIKFELDSLPNNAIIDSAYISFFFRTNIYNESNLTIPASFQNIGVIQRIPNSWDINNADWNNQPFTITQNQVLTPIPESDTHNLSRIDISQLIKDMKLANNYSFLFKQLNEEYYRRLMFASNYYPDSVFRPLLDIYYHTRNIKGTLIFTGDTSACKVYLYNMNNPSIIVDSCFTKDIFVFDNLQEGSYKIEAKPTNPKFDLKIKSNIVVFSNQSTQDVSLSFFVNPDFFKDYYYIKGKVLDCNRNNVEARVYVLNKENGLIDTVVFANTLNGEFAFFIKTGTYYLMADPIIKSYFNKSYFYTSSNIYDALPIYLNTNYGGIELILNSNQSGLDNNYVDNINISHHNNSLQISTYKFSKTKLFIIDLMGHLLYQTNHDFINPFIIDIENIPNSFLLYLILENYDGQIETYSKILSK